MFCLLLTILICISFYLLISAYVSELGLGQKCLLIFLFSSAQVIATVLLLGLAGKLWPSTLTVVNLLVTAAVIYCSFKINIMLVETVQRDLSHIKNILFRYLDCYNILLLLVILPAYSWVILAGYYLPLRGVDDLVYHLPPVFHYIQTHSIGLMPLEIRHHLAFPQNAELLYLWPTIFSKSVRMLDVLNVPFVLVSILLIRELLRFTALPEKECLFVAMLYALCPVVLMQAGSNYIDIIVALFYLLSLYYTLRYLEEQRPIDVFAAGVATGIVIGMKYTALFLSLPLQLLVLWKIFTNRSKHTFLYLIPLLALGCWWYARNLVVLGSPLYPMNIFASGMGVMAGSENSTFMADILKNIRQWGQDFPLHDIGIGSYDGGFGLVFWGLAFPAWICISIISLAKPRFVGPGRAILLFQVPLGFIMLLAIPENQLIYGGRMALFVVPVGLFYLGVVMDKLNSRLCRSVIKSICLLFSLLAGSLLAVSTMPIFRLESVLADKQAGLNPSEYKYVKDANPVYAALRYIWEPLDYLSSDDAAGLDCYLAADRPLSILAPLYGSRLQNRLINIGKLSVREPDVLIYQALPERYKQGRVIKKEMSYFGYEIKLEESLSRPEMVVVTQTAYGCLLMHRSFLQKPDKLKLLQRYYRETWPEEAIVAVTLKNELTGNTPLITADQLGYGLRGLYAGADVTDKVIIVPEGYEGHVARLRGVNQCYTLGASLPGYFSSEVAVIPLNGRQITLYLNHVKDPVDA